MMAECKGQGISLVGGQDSNLRPTDYESVSPVSASCTHCRALRSASGPNCYLAI